ncbi:DUF6886 family protein [Mucilaginibacter ginsenosidivorax]|uniref:Uncharacterized protein n=1 Tax=Mucilaginibacter ginsenosidivorax TaxID=862126 RepID=A0A5B8W9A5_9SPHI|nr:DUF6886 family protein [Mucilaginibacter ginsenosidivorax]QEC79545.1 hypothetical protein FSB76_27680 [Mucilaginibacter ginsenosidivorax]
MLNYHPQLNKQSGLFHVSEQPGIQLFEPRPSPSYFSEIKGDVVFAIDASLLHNYLLPRNCPRVTFYLNAETLWADKERFMGSTTANHVVVVESGWYQRILEATLYCYQLPADGFTLLDACAGYYICYQPVVPTSVTPVNDIIGELLWRNVELRFTPSIIQLANDVSQSSLNFSNIRMRNAK